MKSVITEFYKNLFADFVLRLMNATGGYETKIPLLGRYGCVWKDGKSSKAKQLRSSGDLRMPLWHRLMLNYMNQQRLERMRASGLSTKKRYAKKSSKPRKGYPWITGKLPPTP